MLPWVRIKIPIELGFGAEAVGGMWGVIWGSCACSFGPAVLCLAQLLRDVKMAFWVRTHLLKSILVNIKQKKQEGKKHGINEDVISFC